VCTCHGSEKEVAPEYLEVVGKIPIRNVMPYKQYVKEKFGAK
jgi:hypothetical protein